VAEAIIGAAFLSGGIDNALKVMKALSLPLPGIEQWSDLGRKSGVTPLLHGSTTFQVDFKTIEAIIGCQIKRPELLAQALVCLIPRADSVCSGNNQFRPTFPDQSLKQVLTSDSSSSEMLS